MTGERAERRLAAILAADVAGYSRLMAADEVGTARALRAHRAALDPLITAQGGRVVNTAGDGMLLEFASIVAAVECAVAIQALMAARNRDLPPAQRMDLRIGVNLGDVLIEGDDILGDGVNIAARLEAIAEPGGICLSGDAWRHVEGKVAAAFADAGEHALKNIARPVRVYRFAATPVAGSEPPAAERPAPERPALALPDKPSIAVLPFDNMSGDPEQDYFADGMVEEITTALSRLRWLFVIARNSSFTYKGRAIDVKQVGRELGVRYVLEGSVRKAAARVRITAQLIDAASGVHLWAERFDGALADIFDLQDQVTARVVGAIAPKLERAEIERAARKPTGSLDAYDYYLRGLTQVETATKAANDEALRLFERSLALDQDFAASYGMAARCYILRKANGWMDDAAAETARAAHAARRAIQLGKDDPAALCRAGFALARVVGELAEGAALIERALALDPNLAVAWHFSGLLKAYVGEPDDAVERLGRAMRLSPLDRELYWMQAGMALAHFVAGRYAEGVAWAEQAIRENPTYLPGYRSATVCLALSGRLEEARKTAARLQALDASSRIANITERVPLRRAEDLARYAAALRAAGLPE